MNRSVVAAAVIYAKDMLRIARFYEDMARLARTQTEDAHVVLEGDGFQLTVVAMPSATSARVTISDPPRPREGTAVKLVYFTSSLARSREKAATLGGLVHPAEREWSFGDMRVCDGYDPEGNVFQLRQPADDV